MTEFLIDQGVQRHGGGGKGRVQLTQPATIAGELLTCSSPDTRQGCFEVDCFVSHYSCLLWWSLGPHSSMCSAFCGTILNFGWAKIQHLLLAPLDGSVQVDMNLGLGAS